MNKFLDGDRCRSLGRTYCFETGRADYRLFFVRSGVKIAYVLYHHDANQLVLQQVPEISLTKRTIIGILPFLDMRKFRTERRLIQSKIRMYRKGIFKDRGGDDECL